MSNNEHAARLTLAAASYYGINRLELSHHVIPHLMEIKDDRRSGFVNRLYWRDEEAPEIQRSQWLHPGEAMEETFLRYIVTEKD